MNTSSDSDTSDLSDSNTNSVSPSNQLLCDIIHEISSYISSNNKFISQQFELEVLDIKEYQNIIFLSICDNLKTNVIKGIIYKANYVEKLIVGDKIIGSASVRLYKNELQLVIKSYVKYGLGNALTSLERVKEELALGGYFNNKKEIQSNYNTIGVVTSIQAAGFKDFMHMIFSRCSCKKILLYPATMQGSNAPDEISKAVSLANMHSMVQVIAIIRGGGSKDDLVCFNDKLIAKAIYSSKIPVVTGIGHQIDLSIADLVADKNFITPTATAQGITHQNQISVEKLRGEMAFVSDLFFIKMTSIREYIVGEETKLQKHKNQYIQGHRDHAENINSILSKTRQYIISEIGRKKQIIMLYEKDILDIRDTFLSGVRNKLSSYDMNVCMLNNQVDLLMKSYVSSLRLLGRPRVTKKRNNDEINFVSDLKKGSHYRIHFVDGHHDIKV